MSPFQLIVGFEGMGLHDDIACPHVLRQFDGNGRGLVPLITMPFQGEPNGIRVRRAAVERGGDGGAQFGGAVSLQKPDQGSRDGAEGITAFGRLLEQGLADGGCLEEPVACPMMAGGAFVFDQGLDMGWCFDLFPLVVAAGMGGDDLAAVGDADLVVIRQHGQWPADMGVGDRVDTMGVDSGPLSGRVRLRRPTLGDEP